VRQRLPRISTRYSFSLDGRRVTVPSHIGRQGIEAVQDFVREYIERHPRERRLISTDGS
jgi:hypothetical protein